MRRREFIAGLGGAAVAWPVVARGQHTDRTRRVAVLMGFAEHDLEGRARFEAFREGLESLGWSQGRNLHIDIRYAPLGVRVHDHVQELVALQPDVVFTASTPMAAAVQRTTRLLPIVFVGVSDPIGSGFIVNLARPGGNLTGLQLYEDTIASKWLAMLKEFAPGLTRCALVANPRTTPYEYFFRSAAQAAASLAVELIPLRVESAVEIESSIETFARTPGGGFVVPPDGSMTSHRDLIVALAARHRLPAVYGVRAYVAAGGLMSYSTDRLDEFRRGATYVDRILRGAFPADLPVQAPTKFETTINLKTAKALGLAVPPGLLVAADEVIE